MKDKAEQTETTGASAHKHVTPPPAQQSTKKQPNPGKIISLALVFLVLSVFGGAFGAWMVVKEGGNATSTSIGRNAANDGNKIVLQNEEGISKVATDVSPSVVSIRTDNPTRRGLVQGAGTGIIVSKDGYVVTNKHVVDGASGATVTGSSGEIYDKVKVVGTDPLNDVAFLKIENVNDLKPAELGESSTLRIGQTVVAIGNSLGQYQNTVTSGIVSGLGRPVAAQSQDGSQAESLSDLIQTDAAINPGNSGGPLVNLSGQVVGINTAVASDAQGIGFAIPINAVKGLLEGVLKDGKVERAFLGVSYVDITPAVAKERKLSVKRGALVASSRSGPAVQKDGPADKAGIKDGDIITKVGDLEVGQSGGVSSLVAEYRPGDTVKITLLRDGKEEVVNVRLAAYTSPREEAAPIERQQEDQRSQGGGLFLPQFGF